MFKSFFKYSFVQIVPEISKILSEFILNFQIENAKKTYRIKLSRTLIGFPKEKANRKMILHILKMAIIISSNYLIIHTHYKPISRKFFFYQEIEKSIQEIIVFFFQFGNLPLNNLPKNDVWELEK